MIRGRFGAASAGLASTTSVSTGFTGSAGRGGAGRVTGRLGGFNLLDLDRDGFHRLHRNDRNNRRRIGLHHFRDRRFKRDSLFLHFLEGLSVRYAAGFGGGDIFRHGLCSDPAGIPHHDDKAALTRIRTAGRRRLERHEGQNGQAVQRQRRGEAGEHGGGGAAPIDDRGHDAPVASRPSSLSPTARSSSIRAMTIAASLCASAFSFRRPSGCSAK